MKETPTPYANGSAIYSKTRDLVIIGLVSGYSLCSIAGAKSITEEDVRHPCLSRVELPKSDSQSEEGTFTFFDFQETGSCSLSSEPDVLIEFDIVGKPLAGRRIKAKKVIRRDPFLVVAPVADDFIGGND